MGKVSVAWATTAAPATADRLLAREVSRRVGVDAARVRVGRLCPRCGSGRHGRPVLAPLPGHRPSDRPLPHVSLSRSGALTVVAVSEVGPVGVDVEAVGAASFRGIDRVALHADEPPVDDPEDLARLWVRKESLLKATGHGLAVDPRLVRLSGPGTTPALVGWDADEPPPGPVWMVDVDLGAGYVAAVTVLADERPDLLLRKEERGVLSPTASS